ncbi:MAG: hypothetical protein QOH96_3338 [Blastocatellia bacterium]|nr:hypothetical protein [Blastocatellia bacterium]
MIDEKPNEPKKACSGEEKNLTEQSRRSACLPGRYLEFRYFLRVFAPVSPSITSCGLIQLPLREENTHFMLPQCRYQDDKSHLYRRNLSVAGSRQVPDINAITCGESGVA